MPRIEAGTLEFVGVTCRNAALSGNAKRLAGAGLKLLNLVDSHVDACQRENSAPACQPGCDSCCHRLVQASLPEVLLVADRAREWSGAERDAFLARADESERENGAYWRDESSAAQAACPFLVEGLCSIYSIRPASCRSLSSFDAAACRAHYLGDAPEPGGVAGQDAAMTLSRVAGEGCQRAGIVSGLFDLGASVARVLRDPDMAERLAPLGSPWEKVKLYSENSRRSLPAGERADRAFSTPQALRALELARQGLAGEIANLPWDASERLPQVLMGMTLPANYESSAELEDRWHRLDDAIGRLEEYEGDPGEAFECLHYFNTFNWAYAGKDARAYAERLMAKVRGWAAAALRGLVAPIERPRRGGRLRVGFASSRLRSFNGSRWALGLIRALGQDFETYAIHLGAEEDATSLAFRRNADIYAHLSLPAPAAAQAIRGLDLDALIYTDIGMDGRSLQLASLRLARRQFNAWGHPITSGAPEMDFYLSSDWMEPADADAHYSERLIRLPGNGLSTPFRPSVPSRKGAAELGVPDGGFLLCCQIPEKLIPTHDDLFRRVIRESALPVVFIGAQQEHAKALLQKRLGGENTLFLDPLPRPDYLRLLQLAEASLESPAFGGGFTAIDALSLGTPVLTLPGKFMRGRLSVGYSRVVGYEGFLATSEYDYVDLATDASRRRQLRAGYDGSRLFDNAEAYRAFENILLDSDF